MTPDLWVGLITLALLFLAEGIAPFYLDRTHRLRHGGRNLALALVGGGIGAAFAPAMLWAMQTAATQGWGLAHWLALPTWAGALIAFVLFDLWMYIWHRLNHRVPLLWRLHRVHHSDPAMDATTALRFHPGEILISSLLNLPLLMLIGMTLDTLILYKAVMFVVILLHHSNVALSPGLDRALGRVCVPPSMHRVHHSERRAETDSNYGTILPYWDRLFGSYRQRADLADIRFGMGRFVEPRWQRLAGLLQIPLIGKDDPRAPAYPAND
ncbi:sterol desaturase family protein [Thiohalocapsa marina]|uniref:sterol desaturase family protein n=1 Tax=Thiohalocapsa marina TaxID=424902 RepID=UPI0036DA6B57